MSDYEMPLSGVTLITGPLQAGKTSATADALDRWLAHYGHEDVVIIELAPEIQTPEGVIGGRLDRFIEIPKTIWYGTIDAIGPRSTGETRDEIDQLARQNANELLDLLDRAPPSPQAVFVNDATIGFQHSPNHVSHLERYCSEATCVVLNAYDGDEFDDDDPVSQREQAALERLRTWADREISLE